MATTPHQATQVDKSAYNMSWGYSNKSITWFNDGKEKLCTINLTCPYCKRHSACDATPFLFEYLEPCPECGGAKFDIWDNTYAIPTKIAGGKLTVGQFEFQCQECWHRFLFRGTATVECMHPKCREEFRVSLPPSTWGKRPHLL
jgi:hypothetical protein